MTGWQSPSGSEWHEATQSGRPFLAFGIPRYGFAVERYAIVYFETGEGCREANNKERFLVTHWMPLPAPPEV